MQIPRKKIEKSLKKKGFVNDQNDHRYFYHEYNGKRTGVYTYTSHGSKYKDYDNSLIKLLKRELKLDSTMDAMNFLKCPMTQQQYEKKLKNKGIIPK
jgi:hypothetical protein